MNGLKINLKIRFNQVESGGEGIEYFPPIFILWCIPTINYYKMVNKGTLGILH